MKTPSPAESMSSYLQESIESIEALKGSTFARMVAVSHLAVHTGRMVAQCMLSYNVPDTVQRLVLEQFNNFSVAALACLAEESKLSEKEMEEVLGWAGKFDERVIDTIQAMQKP